MTLAFEEDHGAKRRKQMASNPHVIESAFLPSVHRFYDDLVGMVMGIMSYWFSVHAFNATNMPVDFHERSLEDWMRAIGPIREPDLPLRFPRRATRDVISFLPNWAFPVVALGDWPIQLMYQIEPIVFAGRQWPAPRHHPGNRMDEYFAGAAFVSFWARTEDDLKNKYGSDKSQWSDELTFARHVRNGFAHGGAFNFGAMPSSRPTVTWRGFSLDSTFHGQRVLHEPNTLAIGDIILLMDDVNRLL